MIGMSLIETSLLIVLFAILTERFSARLRMPTEILWVIGSLMVSFLPWAPKYHIAPEIVFQIFLPPILFAAAYFTSWRDFKQNRRPIALLAVGCVIFTATAVALTLKAFCSQCSWADAFLLGAIVSPPDASAATSIIRSLRAPRRLVTILEGESLVNDATALILYRFAIATIVTGKFSPTAALSHFVLVAAGGVIVGLSIAYVSFEILKRLDTVYGQTTLSMVISFLSYIIAEHLGVSGVISTVVAGLYFGRQFPIHTSGQTRMDALASWKVLIYILNGFVFVLIGLQLPQVMKNIDMYSVPQLLLMSAAITAAVIVVRMVWVFPGTYLPRLFRSIREKDPMPPKANIIILGWTGMRGIVSLAAALAIPTTLPSGAPFPNRDIIIFISYVVMIATLVIPAISLPRLMRYLGVKEGGEGAMEEALARVRSMEAVVKRFEKQELLKQFPESLVSDVRDRYQKKLESLRGVFTPNSFSVLNQDESNMRRLVREALDVERSALIELRHKGEIHDEIFHSLSYELDIEELRAKSLRL